MLQIVLLQYSVGGRVITLNCNHNNNLVCKNMLLTRTKRAYKDKSTC